MTDVDIQSLFDTEAVIERKSRGKIGFAKVLVPIDEVDQAFSEKFYSSGPERRKLRVAKWDKKPSLPPPPGPGTGCFVRHQ